MGKILEILKQAEGGGGKPAAPASRPRPYHPEPIAHAPKAVEIVEQAEELEEEDNEEEVPFIEVGGPRKAIDASPSVLAATVNRLKKTEPPALARTPPTEDAAAPRSAAPIEAPVREPVTDELPRMLIAPLSPGAGPALMAVAYRPLDVTPPPLASPRERFAPELVAFHRSQHPVSQQYRALLGMLLGSSATGSAEAILFTGAGPGAGVTTTMLNLAVTAAREGKKRVVVVEAGTRRPAVAAMLGLRPGPGLHEVLAGTVSHQGAVQESGLTGLHVLTAGAVAAVGAGRLVGDAMRAVLRHLRSRFDLILVDAMPWDGRPDVVALGALCDTVYLVVPHEDHQKPEVADLLQIIPQQGSRLRGCILTYR
jgi:Mrp family chromosome partitioning ATPase